MTEWVSWEGMPMFKVLVFDGAGNRIVRTYADRADAFADARDCARLVAYTLVLERIRRTWHVRWDSRCGE